MDELIELIESMLPDGWSVYDESMGMDCLLEAPDGCVVEQDGKCSHGYVSPLLGVIV